MFYGEVDGEQLTVKRTGPSGVGDGETNPEQRARSISTDLTDDTFDPEEDMAANPLLKLEQFVEEWVTSLIVMIEYHWGLQSSEHLKLHRY